MSRRELLVASLSASALPSSGAHAGDAPSSRLFVDAMAIGGAGSINPGGFGGWP